MLDSSSESLQRLHQVGELIEGFETPYGMELLASVHWVGVHSKPTAKDAAEAVIKVHSWNERKARMFQRQHIAVAWGVWNSSAVCPKKSRFSPHEKWLFECPDPEC